MRAALLQAAREGVAEVVAVDASGHESTARYVGQALGWLFSTYDNLTQQPGKTPDLHGRAPGHPVGQLLPGLRYARDLALHGYTVATTRLRGGSLPGNLPFNLAALTWEEADQLPLTAHPGGERKRAVYAEHLEGRSVPRTLQDVLAWLEEEVRAAEPGEPETSVLTAP